MTEQDRQEVRQIIQAELQKYGFAAITTVAYPASPAKYAAGNVYAAAQVPCQHDWYDDFSETVAVTRCRRCLAIKTTW